MKRGRRCRGCHGGPGSSTADRQRRPGHCDGTADADMPRLNRPVVCRVLCGLLMARAGDMPVLCRSVSHAPAAGDGDENDKSQRCCAYPEHFQRIGMRWRFGNVAPPRNKRVVESLPVFLSLKGRPVILLGEGAAAAAKARLLDRAGAWIIRDEMADAAIAIVAIEDDAAARLKARGILVNAMDRPALCDFTRSEEHTSELQSLMRISYAVFCLKKK